jgi:sigma-E factor negative regulatory protein RseC
MIEEQAVVVDREGDYVWLQTQRKSSCGQCSVKNGCGTQVLSGVLGNKAAYVRCFNSLDAIIGDRVVIGINENVLLTGSVMLYFMPLLLMLIFGGIASLFAAQLFSEWVDLITIAASVTGLWLGLRGAQYYARQGKQKARFQPVLIKKLPMHSFQSKPVKLDLQ